MMFKKDGADALRQKIELEIHAYCRDNEISGYHDLLEGIERQINHFIEKQPTALTAWKAFLGEQGILFEEKTDEENNTALYFKQKAGLTNIMYFNPDGSLYKGEGK